MRILTPADLLFAWESGIAQRPARRPAALLAALDGEASLEACARLPIGRRDARLLAWRERILGPRVRALAACETCGESVELDFTLADIRAVQDGSEVPPILELQAADGAVRFRLPDTNDVAALAAEPDVASARSRLLERCVENGARLSDTAAAAVAARMAEADPQADVQVDLKCPACGCEWSAPFDIAEFFWTELAGAARRLLREVHELAGAYGWTERDILALTPPRRHAYLELART